jgi:hypothetical protein
MVRYLLFFLLSSNQFYTFAQADSLLSLPLPTLEGTWYVNQSNFPMWTSGKNLNPTFNYSTFKQGNDTLIWDEVSYLKKGKKKTIDGIDTVLDEEGMHFRWRGTGLKSIIKSDWEILYYNFDQDWFILSFEGTIFTSAGYDVISREKEFSIQQQEMVKRVLNELGIFVNLTNISQI